MTPPGDRGRAHDADEEVGRDVVAPLNRDVVAPLNRDVVAPGNRDVVDLAGDASFPASDPPGWWSGSDDRLPPPRE